VVGGLRCERHANGKRRVEEKMKFIRVMEVRCGQSRENDPEDVYVMIGIFILGVLEQTSGNCVI
jgi:hypothetical protein